MGGKNQIKKKMDKKISYKSMALYELEREISFLSDIGLEGYEIDYIIYLKERREKL